MQIVLFKDDHVNRTIPKLTGLIKTLSYSKPKTKTEEELIQIINEASSSDTMALLRYNRKYLNKLGLVVDSHYKLESLGLSSLSRDYTTIIDYSKALDFILANLSGCSCLNLKGLPKYEDISKALLTLDTNSFDISLEELMFVDSNLDNYLNSCLTYNSEISCMEKILGDILRFCNSMMYYIGFYIQQNIDHAVCRSFGAGGIVITSNEELPFSEIEIYSKDGKVSCALPCITFNNKEYHDKILRREYSI